jgi:hypothetical protein
MTSRTDNQDELARVYARIGAMRANLTSAQAVSSDFGWEYDGLVGRAARASGVDLAEFKIGNDHMIANSSAHEADGFRSRLDGLLGYLRSLMPAETVDKIGFR